MRPLSSMLNYKDRSVQSGLHPSAGLPRFRKFITDCKNMKLYLLLILPAIAWFTVFHYVPIYGVIIAFKDYRFVDGILGSEWVGLVHFRRAFQSPQFWRVTRNTVIISLYRLVFGFPVPIIFALLLNELRQPFFKKTVQTISYLPHFLSWVVLAGIFKEILSPSYGVINHIIEGLGFKRVYFLARPDWFRTVLVTTGIYKSMGWGSILYLAAISGVDSEQYESAVIDGASRFKQVKFITLPSIMYMIAILLIFQVSALLIEGFDQIFNLYNPLVYTVGDVIDTYVYRIGLVDLNYSLSTAINLFRNVIGLALLFGANLFGKKLGYGIF